MRTDLLTVLILPLLLSINGYTSFAQEEQTFRDNKGKVLAGFQISPAVYTIIPHAPTSVVTKTAIGYFVGISGEFRFSKHFSLHHEVNYGSIGYTDYGGNLPYPYPFNKEIKKTSYHATCIYIPASLRWFALQGKKTAFFLNIGFFSNLIVKSRRIREYVDGSVDDDNRNHTVSSESWTGILGGIGIDRQLTERWHLFINARDQVPMNQFGDIIQLLTLHVGASYKF